MVVHALQAQTNFLPEANNNIGIATNNMSENDNKEMNKGMVGR